MAELVALRESMTGSIVSRSKYFERLSAEARRMEWNGSSPSAPSGRNGGERWHHFPLKCFPLKVGCWLRKRLIMAGHRINLRSRESETSEMSTNWRVGRLTWLTAAKFRWPTPLIFALPRWRRPSERQIIICKSASKSGNRQVEIVF